MSKTMRMDVVRARVNIVATKLGIIFLFPSTYFSQLLCGHGVCALWVSEHPPRRTHILIITYFQR